VALNLTGVRGVVNSYMLDTISVTRRAEDGSSVMNPTTMELTWPTTSVYSGQAFVAAMGSPSEQVVGTTQPVARLTYEVAIPYDETVEIKPMDDITVVTSQDAKLVGKKLIVTGIIPTTFVTHRRIAAYMDTPSA